MNTLEKSILEKLAASGSLAFKQLTPEETRWYQDNVAPTAAKLRASRDSAAIAAANNRAVKVSGNV